MDLYISAKENLHFNPSYPNTHGTLFDISFAFSPPFSIKEGNCSASVQKAQGVNHPRGFLGMQTHCYCWQAAVR